MSDLSAIQKAIEDGQKKTADLFEAQRQEISKTGEVSKKMQEDFLAVQDELKKAGARLFDLEQKAIKAQNEPREEKTFAERVAEDALKSWNGSKGSVEVKTFVEKAVTSVAASGGTLVQPYQVPGIVMPGLQRLTVRQLLAQGRITSNSLEYVRENVFTNSAAPVAEGTLKPESDLTFTKQTANVKTIAHWIQASRQIIDDAPLLESYINNRLMYGLALVEEGQLLNGDGTGDNLIGLNTVATAYDATLDAAGDTLVDKLAHAIYQVTESEFEATGLVMNPRDWHSISLLKDAEGRYILGGPQAFASRVLWGLPVVATQSQAAGTFTVGAFSMASQVFDRMDATVELSREDRDNFVKNMITILCEERLALAHYRPQAIIKGALETAPGGGE